MAPPDTPSNARRLIDDAAVRGIVRRLAAHPQPPWLHGEVARRMAERLPVILKQPRTVIQWSGFLGASDAVLLAAYPQARRVVVESDPALRERSAAAHRAPWWSPRRWTAAPLVVSPDEVQPAAGELVWANMLLQAAADPPALMAQWQRALAVDGFLMFSSLGPGTLPQLRALYQAQGWGAPMAALIDMHDLGDMLVHAGFADPVMDQETVTLTWASAEAALAELRMLGGNGHPGRHAGLRTPRWRAQLLQALQAQADAQGRIALSFELVYGHAFRPAPKARVQAQTEVSLDAMREMVRSGRRGTP
ncbi:biotin synthase [Ideonella sp. BN130291]|uniref:biotin synthase n=1 Tax=Ideonella sp. BN130291 TaxID=3112940 RepID=UPI002E2627A9|nr:biotin synthase [Ideonella sp. BN130291]